jgi:hypothetical protein
MNFPEGAKLIVLEAQHVLQRIKEEKQEKKIEG